MELLILNGIAQHLYTQSIESKIFGDIFFLDVIFDLSKNNKKIKNIIIGQE